MTKINYKKIFITIFCFFVLLTPVFTSYAYDFGKDSGLTDTANKTGHTEMKATNPTDLISTIIQGILGLLGVCFLIIMIYGGFLWMTAQGNQEQVEKSKKIIINGILGLAIVFASYAFSYLLVNTFSESRIAK